MKRLYFVETSGGKMVVSDDGETRRILFDGNENLFVVKDHEAYLKQIEDDSSWEAYEEPIDELLGEDYIVLAKIETDNL